MAMTLGCTNHAMTYRYMETARLVIQTSHPKNVKCILANTLLLCWAKFILLAASRNCLWDIPHEAQVYTEGLLCFPYIGHP